MFHAVLRMTVVHSNMQTHEQFLKMRVGLGLDLFFLCVCLGLVFACCSDLLRLFCSCVFCFCCVRFSFFSTVPRDWLGRTSPKWPISCRVGRKTLTVSIKFVLFSMQYLWIFMSLCCQYVVSAFSFSAMTLLVGRQQGRPACKNSLVRYWRG